MELNITHLMERPDDMYLYSASCVEMEDAGKVTWENSLDVFDPDSYFSDEDIPWLLSQDQLPEFRDYIRDFGAWDNEEIDSWDAQECNALCLQLIAGDIRERYYYVDSGRLEEYEQNIGKIYAAPDGQWFYYIGR